MINYSEDFIMLKIKEAEKHKTAYMFKNFLNQVSVPNWSDILNSLYYAASLENDVNLSTSAQSHESVVGRLVGSPDLSKESITTNRTDIYFATQKLQFDELFPFLNNVFLKELPPVFSFIGPKVSIGPFKVGYHEDKWSGASLQCEGIAKWSFKDKEQTKFLQFEAEKGDLVYFHKSLLHQIETDKPRASIQFSVPDLIDLVV